MRRSLLWLAIALLWAAPVAGQTTADPVFQKVTAIVTTAAPIYVVPRPGPTLGPIRTAAIGTVLVVLNEKDDWLQVEFNDPQYGRRVGWLEKKLVRVDDPAVRPMDLSVPAVRTRPPATPPTGGTVTSPPTGAPAPSRELAGLRTREGFTVLVNFGVGVQRIAGLDPSVGLAGVNVGVGGFLTNDLALLFRFSGTNVSRDLGPFDTLTLVSGVLGPTVQYWVSDRINIQGGVGPAFWDEAFSRETGFGVIVGMGAVVLSKGKHSLQVGVEYAPAFTDSATVHNLGVTFGYQFHR
jgi:hypothetical protein